VVLVVTRMMLVAVVVARELRFFLDGLTPNLSNLNLKIKNLVSFN